MSAEIKNNPELSKYIKEFEEDVTITQFNLREKALTQTSTWAKWLSYLYHEKENLDKIHETKQKIIKTKMQSSNTADSILRMKSEDKISQNDENVKKLNVLAKMTQDNIDYIERALNILSNVGFQIRNVTEVIKLNLQH